MNWERRPDGSSTTHIDTRGVDTLDGVVALVVQAFDDVIARSMETSEITLIDLGVPADEVAEQLADLHRECLADKAAFLQRIRTRLVD